MSDCEEKIYSNDYLDFIISKDVLDVIDLSSDCIQRIDEENDIYFYPKSFFRIFDFPADSYASVPKCYGLLDETALEVSGILKLQQQPALALKGQGVMIGFIDTGIDYRNPVFQYSDGTTRIYRIWDQTIRDGTKPEGIAYGSEYKAEQINAALRAENPLETVPSMDTNGHGTFVAGVACGSEDVEDNFIGAAPFSEIAVVKLKEAKTYLREFYFIPDSVPAYQENDIMMAVSYLDRLARERDMPLVICIASSIVFPLTISVAMLLVATAAPQPNVLNLHSLMICVSSSMSRNILMISPHFALPTVPTPLASSISPTFLGC